jgi:Glyoxalase-like domain
VRAVPDEPEFPQLRGVALDCTDPRALAEFYRLLLGLEYQPGDEPPAEGKPDPKADDWLVLRNQRGTSLAFQKVNELRASTWPDGTVPQQLHLDASVPTKEALDAHHVRALSLGARLLSDRSDDPEEAIRVYADPAGHPFCLFVVPTA